MFLCAGLTSEILEIVRVAFTRLVTPNLTVSGGRAVEGWGLEFLGGSPNSPDQHLI